MNGILKGNGQIKIIFPSDLISLEHIFCIGGSEKIVHA